MMSALDRLKTLLREGSKQALDKPWAVDNPLDAHIAKLQRYLREGAATPISRDLQEEAVLRFWASRRVDTLREARLVSHGVALPVGPQRLRIIEDRERFPALLDGVDRYLPMPRQYRRCYQGLLSGYFGYDPEAQETPKIGQENWQALRYYLGEHSVGVIDGVRNPQWADSLQRHPTLFGRDPCAPYGPALLVGDRAAVDELREVLHISNSSWFMRKLFLAQVRAAVQKADPEFLKLLPRVLDLLHDNQIIRDEGLALVLDRYAALRPPPLSAPLRDRAVDGWGNPWLQSNAMRWGRVSSDARTMVTEWLKLEFIEAFFTLLAEEHTGDNRRLDFWRRYVNAIDDIHFVLGADAWVNRTPDFQALRKKMEGQLVELRGNVRTNNAFIMRMGSLVIVEFSDYSNACYGYDATKALPFRMDIPVVMRVDARNSLKCKSKSLWLQHQDGIMGYETWEKRFTAELANGYGIWPKQTLGRTNGAQPRSWNAEVSQDVRSWKGINYSQRALAQFADHFGLRIEDLTPQNGNLWIRTDDSHLQVNEVLLKWDFQYKNAQKGWWRSK